MAVADQALAALGTKNPGKKEACELCFKEWPSPSYKLECVSTPSGVSDQPMGLEETTLGAKNRAQKALEAVEGAVIGIGMESGLVEMEGMLMDFCVTSVFDGTRHSIGVSSMFPLPPKVAASLATKGYNQSFEDIGVPADENGAGVLSQMSDGVLSRPKQMKESILMALLQLRNPQLYSV
eukprot:TRINITY_DN24563_c0_g1_i1.p1 TRINITY_DN24563_c0_g1~~TRINITY_DN24563_c0_g1_i1.p1  ORF type:complete len:180 (+),score=40.64 TRINITY_DN24563_c0_g1_i1:49-588(+)